MMKKFLVRVGGKDYEVVKDNSDRWQINGHSTNLEISAQGNGSYIIIHEGKVYRIYVSPSEKKSQSQNSISLLKEFHLKLNGRSYSVTVIDERSRLLQSVLKNVPHGETTTTIRAPMPGMVVKIEVSEGDSIPSGKGLLVLEAMKMENEIKAPTISRVQKIHVAPRQPVDKGDPLVTLIQN
jgi:biotin carboxyl carrier protein